VKTESTNPARLFRDLGDQIHHFQFLVGRNFTNFQLDIAFSFLKASISFSSTETALFTCVFPAESHTADVDGGDFHTPSTMRSTSLGW
jgi:hypothetical protein